MTRLRHTLAIAALGVSMVACGSDNPDNGGNGQTPDPGKPSTELSASRNLRRSIEIIDAAIGNYMEGDGMKMARYYNPYTGQRSDETGSVWMYTSSIEAVNAAMRAMEALKGKGDASLYDANFASYKELLSKLYAGMEYYKGTFTHTSYTQTREWDVYGVNRGRDKGAAEVSGVLNVYDDQMWIIRELLESYRTTGIQDYLGKAEYLAEYVLDGWDCTLDADGNQNGGITWGPGYATKHSCSNGPLISPLVWLSEIYKGKDDKITCRYIDSDSRRCEKTMDKAGYYLDFAKAVYDWQKRNLLVPSTGVYDDFMGGGPDIAYETVDGVRYRAHSPKPDRVGPAYSYNSGTMISGAADLYAATGDPVYLEDLKALSDKSFATFAKEGVSHKGFYEFDLNGFNTWFNGVLMRSYHEALPYNPGNAAYLKAFQDNLDYAYDNFLYGGMLPTSLLGGWNRDRQRNNTEGMFEFTFGAEYAVLAINQLNKN